MPPKATSRYHHGDLRATLLRNAEVMLREHGLEGLSLRRLAEHAGVTTGAPYHHFANKNELLCALAERGFIELDEALTRAMASRDGSARERTLRFVRAYMGFAAAHPDIYDLMFGRVLWKAGNPTESLREVAYATFRRYREHAHELSGTGPERGRRGLRRAQAGWATLHGLCRLLIDGIYADGADLDGMTQAATDLLMGKSVSE